jgi:hypothetical protein
VIVMIRKRIEREKLGSYELEGSPDGTTQTQQRRRFGLHNTSAHATSIIQLGRGTLHYPRSVLDSRSPLTAATLFYFVCFTGCHIMRSGRCMYRTAFSQIDLLFYFILFCFSDDLFDFTFVRRKLTKFITVALLTL